MLVRLHLVKTFSIRDPGLMSEVKEDGVTAASFGNELFVLGWGSIIFIIQSN